MRNLTLLQHACDTLRTDAQPRAASDPDSGGPLLAIEGGSGTRYVLSPLGRVQAIDSTGQWLWEEVLSGPDVDEHVESRLGTWIHISYVADIESLLLARRDGTLLTLSIHGPPRALELIGKFDGGIEAMAWSVDHSQLLVVTGAFSVLVMTAQWDVIAEIECAPFIGQCNATVAAAAARSASDHPLQPCLSVHAAWRPDAQRLVISCVDAVTRRRTLRIYDHGLESMDLGRNEDGSSVDGLHPGVAWSSDGALIACGMSVSPRSASPAHLQISFFESNGLRHRELLLQGYDPRLTVVQSVAWNAAAVEGGCDLLSVVLAPSVTVTTAAAAAAASVSQLVSSEPAAALESSNPAGWRVLQLWHRDNYQWCLKRELVFPTGDNSRDFSALSTVVWDPSRPYRLHLLTASSLGITAVSGGTGCADDVSSSGSDNRVRALKVHCLDYCWDYTAGEMSSSTSGCVDLPLPDENHNGTSDYLVHPRETRAGTVVATLGSGGGLGRVSLTPISWSPVPPPMSYVSLSLTAAEATRARGCGAATPVEVAFAPLADSNHHHQTIHSSQQHTLVEDEQQQQQQQQQQLATVGVSILTAQGALVVANVALAKPGSAGTAAIRRLRSSSTVPPSSKLTAAAAPQPGLLTSPRVKVTCGAPGDCGSGAILWSYCVQLHGVVARVVADVQWNQEEFDYHATSGALTVAGNAAAEHDHVTNDTDVAAPSQLRRLSAPSLRQIVWLQRGCGSGGGAGSALDCFAGVINWSGALDRSSNGDAHGDSIVIFWASPSSVGDEGHSAAATRSAQVLDAALLPLPPGKSVVRLTASPPHPDQDTTASHAGRGSLHSRAATLVVELSDGTVYACEATRSPSCSAAALELIAPTSLTCAPSPAPASHTSFRVSLLARLPEVCLWILPLVLERTALTASAVAAEATPRHLVEGLGTSSNHSAVGMGPTSVLSLPTDPPAVLVPLSLSKSGNMFVGSALLSSGVVAPHGIAWHATHRLLLVAMQGPVPTLVYLAEADLLRRAGAYSSSAVQQQQHPQDAYRAQEAERRGEATDSDAALHRGSGQQPQQQQLWTEGAEYAGAAVSGADVVWSRPLERGSRLVAVDKATDTLLMQMPRGNTESVVPRALTLCSIRRCLDARPIPAFGTALELARKHRVDMNVLYDHNPHAFANESWMGAAVRQIAAGGTGTKRTNGGGGSSSSGSASAAPESRRGVAAAAASGAFGHDRWDLLLSALTEEDVSAGKYRPLPQQLLLRDAAAAAASRVLAPTPASSPSITASSMLDAAAITAADPSLWSAVRSDNKVTRACALVRAALLREMVVVSQLQLPTSATVEWQHPLVLSVITSFARQVPADLLSVLGIVQRVNAAAAGARRRAAAPTSVLALVSPESALSHAIMVCDSDVDLLYATALGMYDIPLAGSLAQHGQTDPREYVPLLTSLTRIGQTDPSLTRIGAGAEETNEGIRVHAPPSAPAKGGVPQPWDSTLSIGALRQRWAVDVHLGRWRSALTWLCALGSSDSASSSSLSRAVLQSSGTGTALRQLQSNAVGGGVAAPSTSTFGTAASTPSALHHGSPLSEADFIRAIVGELPSTPGAIIAAGLASPTLTALTLAATRSSPTQPLLRTVADLWGACGRPKVARAALIADAWLCVVTNRAAAGAPAGSSSSSSALSALVQPRILVVRTLEQIDTALAGALRGVHACSDALLLAYCPATGESGRVRSAGPGAVLEALDVFLRVAAPPALDDALALALAHCGNAALTYHGTPLWKLVFSLSAMPTSIARRRAPAWPPHCYGTVVLGLRATTPAAEAPAVEAHGGGAEVGEDDKIQSSLPIATSTAAAAATAAVVPIPALPLIARMVARSLQSGRSLASKLSAASVLIDHCGEVEEGVTLLCSVGTASAFTEAARQAAARSRLDLIETVIVPALDDAAVAAVDEIGERREALADALTRLTQCRAIRAAAPITDLLNRYDLAASSVDVTGLLFTDEDDGGGADGETGSVWSDASSMVSGGFKSQVSGSAAGGLSRTGSSASSSSSRLTASNVGRFSHIAHTTLPEHFVASKSLRLSATDLTHAQVSAARAKDVQTVMARMEKRSDARNIAAAAAASSASGWERGSTTSSSISGPAGHYQNRGKLRRHRPGSRA